MRTWLFALIAASAVVGTAASPSRARAWGKDGHELVGKIADKHLNTRTRAAIDELLQDHQFRSIADGRLANFADTIRGSVVFRRKFPKMGQFHFIDIPIDADLANLDLARFCDDGDCVLGATKRFQAVLKDPTKPAQDRREAMFFIVHFVGDLHQPLHCAERNGDRGGNLVRVHMAAGDRHVTNLHKVWDTDLVEEAVGPLALADYAARLSNTLGTEARKKFQAGKLEDWILDSHQIAREKVYVDKGEPIPADGPPHTLSARYMLDGAEIVEVQLTKGGVRLAQFLNDTFKDE